MPPRPPGLAVRVFAARDYPLKDLAGERLLTVVISTHGDGDPPDDARGFVEHITGKRAPKLEGLAYAVLALGDSSYPKFCETGRQVDERLAALGARRLLPRVECDVDFERLAAPWLDQVVTGARDAVGGREVATVTRLRSVPTAPLYDREQPFEARVVANQRITGRDGSKDVRHIEISLEGSGLKYQPGDALGVWHENPPLVVDAVLAALAPARRLAGGARWRTRTLREWLSSSARDHSADAAVPDAARAARRAAPSSRQCSSPATRTGCGTRSRTCNFSTCCRPIRPPGRRRRSSRHFDRWRRDSIRSHPHRTPWATRCT